MLSISLFLFNVLPTFHLDGEEILVSGLNLLGKWWNAKSGPDLELGVRGWSGLSLDRRVRHKIVSVMGRVTLVLVGSTCTLAIAKELLMVLPCNPRLIFHFHQLHLHQTFNHCQTGHPQRRLLLFAVTDYMSVICIPR